MRWGGAGGAHTPPNPSKGSAVQGLSHSARDAIYRLLGSPQRIRQVEPLMVSRCGGKGRGTGQCMVLTRINRAIARLVVLRHAIERVREDGDEAQQIGNDVCEGLLLACRGLSEYVDEQAQVT